MQFNLNDIVEEPVWNVKVAAIFPQQGLKYLYCEINRMGLVLKALGLTSDTAIMSKLGYFLLCGIVIIWCD